MSDPSIVDILRRLIVGKRGRGRADKLVCTGADNVQKTITVKPQGSVTRYVDLVTACAPVRIEAYAGKELVDAWVVDVPAPPGANADAPSRKTKEKPSKKTKGTWNENSAVQANLASHIAALLSSGYKDHSRELAGAYKTNVEREKGVWQSLVDVAQHHADRAAHAEARAAAAEKAVRIRDRQILELNASLIALNAKLAELTIGGPEDEKSKAFMQLMGFAKDKQAADAAAAAAAGAAKKGNAS